MICRREEGDSVRSCFYKQTLLGEVCICAWRTVLLLYLHVRAGPACCWWAWAWGRRPTASSSGSPGPESRGAGRSCRAAGAPLCRPPPISLYSTVGRRQTVSQSVSQSQRFTESSSHSESGLTAGLHHPQRQGCYSGLPAGDRKTGRDSSLWCSMLGGGGGW